MKKMVDRIQLIQDVVKVLRVQDMKRRLAAAITIQKYFRTFLVRSRILSSAQREKLRVLKTQRVRAQNTGRSAGSGNATGATLTLKRSIRRSHKGGSGTVSYTHLTLPTKRIV
eukprot:TRINITY_DN27100_c0_g1_i1.p1 TRINITY_DN27100_c0_g1~~TRINITY_DN27100_c0_g1_i1.p1  ORF type:complete len:113 (-),score=18.29 TRINITY_DN27100_c0_g1_i1:158-496(-)